MAVAGQREKFKEYLRGYDRKARGAGSEKKPPTDRFSGLDVRHVFEKGLDRGLSKSDAARDVLIYAADLEGRSRMGTATERELEKLRGYLKDEDKVPPTHADPPRGTTPTTPGQPYDGPFPDPNLFGIPEGGEGLFTGGIPADKSYFDFMGGDPANPRSYSTFGQDGPIGLARLDPPVRTENFGVPIGMPTFRGNVGMPGVTTPADVGGVDEGSEESEQEGSYSGSSFLDGVLAGLVPTLGPAIGTGLGNLFGDVLQGEPEQQVSVNPILMDGAVGDFGPFGSETVAMSRNAAGTLGNILNAFTGSVMA